MPLRNEAVLKSTLDALFFKDTIMNQLNAIPIETLNVEFPILPDESLMPIFNGFVNGFL